MQVSVEKVSNVERRLTIVVPANQVEEAYAKQIDEYSKKANLKGFRPGKAPRSHIEQRFGEDARKEALSEVIQKALYQAITEQNLRPVSQPRVEPKTMLANQPLEFVASFEVLPEIEKVNFNLDKIEKPVVELSQADIDRVIEQLRKQSASWNVVDRGAQENDRVVLDYYAMFDGKSEEQNKIQNYPLEIGSKSMIPGFEEALLGIKASEERKFTVNFPSDFPDADKAGKPVEFVVTAKQVYAADFPNLDESFLQKLGIKTGKMEDLQEQIKQSLTLERDRLIKEKLKEQIFQNLLDQNPMDIPQSMIEREAKIIHDEIYPQHQPHDHHQHTIDELATFNDIAKKRVALGLLIAEYAKQANLKVDKALVDQRIKEIATVYERPEEVIAWLSSKERLGGIEAQVMEDQVMDKLMENVSATEKTMSYAELKGIRI